MSVVIGNSVLAAFPNQASALRAIRELIQASFSASEVELLGEDDNETVSGDDSTAHHSSLAVEKKDLIRRFSLLGALFGSILGSVAVISLAASWFYGFDPVRQKETLSLLPGGAMAGLLAGGCVGVLVGMAWLKRNLRDLEFALESGWIGVRVCTEERQTDAATILDGNGARPREVIFSNQMEPSAARPMWQT